MLANSTAQAQLSFGVEGCFDYQPKNNRKDPTLVIPPFQTEENDSIFERGFDKNSNQTNIKNDVEESKETILKLNFNKATETNNKQDSDGSNSPFNKNKNISRNNCEEMNVPLSEMLNDIANKRGISKLEDFKTREMRVVFIFKNRNNLQYDKNRKT